MIWMITWNGCFWVPQLSISQKLARELVTEMCWLFVCKLSLTFIFRNRVIAKRSPIVSILDFHLTRQDCNQWYLLWTTFSRNGCNMWQKSFHLKYLALSILQMCLQIFFKKNCNLTKLNPVSMHLEVVGPKCKFHPSNAFYLFRYFSTLVKSTFHSVFFPSV